VRRQLLEKELLSQVAQRGAAETDVGVFERQSDALAILGRIVEI
jgi:hypothetical protein